MSFAQRRTGIFCSERRCGEGKKSNLRKSKEEEQKEDTAKEGIQYQAGEFGGDESDEATPVQKRKTVAAECRRR